MYGPLSLAEWLGAPDEPDSSSLAVAGVVSAALPLPAWLGRSLWLRRQSLRPAAHCWIRQCLRSASRWGC